MPYKYALRKAEEPMISPPDEHETVVVSKRALWMLYQCAKSYGTRIPAEAHYDWAIPFIEMFEPNDHLFAESQTKREWEMANALEDDLIAEARGRGEQAVKDAVTQEAIAHRDRDNAPRHCALCAAVNAAGL